MVKMFFVPNDENGYNKPINLEFGLSDDASLDEYFEAFKSFCYAIGFNFIDDYEIVEKDEGPNDFEKEEYENCGEILTANDRISLNAAFSKGFADGKFNVLVDSEINEKPKEGKDNDSTT